VERRYGDRVALVPTDFELRTGELVALVGPNGAGKSTLLSLLAGALPPSGGAVVQADPSPTVGWAPQRPALYGHLTARENVDLFARLARLDDPEAASEGVLAQVDLTEATQHAAQLSVGNQQRLNLALALLGDPDVLLLDEPTASLDPKQRRRLWELLLERKAGGRTALLATHSLEEAAALADRVLLLVDGAVVREGTATDLTEEIG
jgi:ABC-2 type transport system ATP-binding protein